MLKESKEIFKIYINDEVSYLKVASLLSLGVNPNVQDKDGITPLMIAAKLGYTLTGRTLLEGGANINTRDNQGNTALKYAIQNKKDAFIKLLLSYNMESYIKYVSSFYTEENLNKKCLKNEINIY